MIKSTNLQLIQYKIIHRVHYTTHKMFKMGFTNTAICTQCTQNTNDSYIHAMWHCTPVHQFWQEIITFLSHAFVSHIQPSPSLYLLGDISTTNMTKENNRMLLIAPTIAERTTPMNWKTKHNISINHWKNQLMDYISMEKVSESINVKNNNPETSLDTSDKSPAEPYSDLQNS